MAQRIAMRLKSSAAGASPGQSSPGQGNGASQSASSVSTVSHNPGGAGGNGPPDLQRMLSRVPAIKLADLQKGDAVVILATSGGNSDAVTTIKLLAGVEAILTASPSQSASSLLSPWSLGAGGEGEAAQ